MGESSDTPLKLQVDRRVRLDFRGATITSDAGLLHGEFVQVNGADPFFTGIVDGANEKSKT